MIQPHAAASHPQRKLLQINTAGCVDNGKSTLIGRLLFDSGGLALDVIEKIAKKSAGTGHAGALNLALFTDGLREEEKRGITIDVARHYLTRESMDLIIADTPGHQEFTRNMVTGTSASKATLILVDATKGIVEQNRRHAYIASMLGVENIFVLVNKMDLVGYSQEKFDTLTREFDELLSRVTKKRPTYIPIAALHGDNVVDRSAAMRWYDGDSVLGHLERLDPGSKQTIEALRFVVQWIDRAGGTGGREEIVGSVASGRIGAGDTVTTDAGGARGRVRTVHGLDGALASLHFPRNGRLLLDGALRVKRGDILTHPDDAPILTSETEAQICWMDENPLRPGREYLLKLGSRVVPGSVERIHHEVDIGTYRLKEPKGHLALNDIAKVRIATAEPLPWEPFSKQPANGRFILIDPDSGTTAGAGITLDPAESKSSITIAA